MKELREMQVSARIKPRAKRIIDNSKYSYADAIEYFAFNVLNKTEDKKLRLKNLKIENQKMNYEICRNQMEIDDIAKELGINPEDNELFAEDIQKSIKTVINWFNRTTYADIDEFMTAKQSKIKEYSRECNLELDEFKKRVISKVNSKNKD